MSIYYCVTEKKIYIHIYSTALANGQSGEKMNFS